MIDDQVRYGSTPQETFRGTVEGHTPSGESATVIITRQGLGIDARVWLTFDGAIKTTTVLTDRKVAELRELLGGASPAGRARRGCDGGERGTVVRGEWSSGQ